MRNKKIGERIRKYRIMVGMTQEELAEKLSEGEEKSIAQATIAMYECGQRIPKIELRLKIAKILKVDPIALSGIDLDEYDEKRLLCKLLMKYASDISLENEDVVSVSLPKEFVPFQKMYEDNRNSLAKSVNGMSEESLDYKIKTRVANEKMEFWCETQLPQFFYLETVQGDNPTGVARINKVRPYFQYIQEISFEKRFSEYQETYLAPSMNKEIMSQLGDL